MNWAEQSGGWPHAEHSRFIETRSNKWHVQMMGTGPAVLLIHGAGGSTHSWREIMPQLAKSMTVVAIDLPGQGFTQNHHRSRLSLPHMAEDLGQLLETLDIQPAGIVGHSAGAAIMFQMALTHEALGTTKLVSINGALGNFDGLAGRVFPVMAKLLSMNPLTALVFSRTASSDRSVKRLIESTGSQIDAGSLGHYRALFSDRVHVDRTLAMMAQWSLDGLTEKMAALQNNTLFLAGARDQAVPVEVSQDAAQGMTNATFERIEDAGHLLHEERPEQIGERLMQFLITGR